MMRYLFLFFLFVFSLNLTAQQRIALKFNTEGYVYCPDTNILINGFETGLAPFMIKNKDPFDFKKNRVGFIDSAGNVRIPPVYINGSPFHKGTALVQDTSGKYNVIDKFGRQILPSFYHAVSKCDNGMFIVWEKRKFGLFTATGKQVFAPEKYTRFATPPPVYYEGDDIQGPRMFRWEELSIKPRIRFTDFLAVQYNGLWGVINRDGVETVPPTFEGIGLFTGNVAVAVKNKKSGVIDSKGNWLVPPMYDKAAITPYKTVLVTLGKKMGALSIKNKIIIPIIYDGVTQLSANAFQVYEEDKETGGRYGVVSDHNKVIIPIKKYQRITAFGNGFIVDNDRDTNDWHPPYALYNNNGKRISAYTGNGEHLDYPVWALDNPNDSLKYFVFNELKNKFTAYTEVEGDFRQDYISPHRIYYQKNNKWGLLNEQGAEITRPIYDEIKVGAFNFNNALTFAKRNGKWGIIDIEGEILLKFEYDAYDQLRPGCYWLRKGDRYRFIPYDLRYLTPLLYDKPAQQFRSNYYYNHDFIPVQENGKWGFLNSTGQQLTPCIYDDVIIGERTYNQITPVKTGSKWGFLDKNFHTVAAVQYDEYRYVGYYDSRHPPKLVWVVTENHKRGLLDTACREIVPCIYDEMFENYQTSFTVVKDKLYGLLSLDGSILVKPAYDKIEKLDQQFESGHAWYRIIKNGKTGLMNEKGGVVIPCLYTDPWFERIGNLRLKKDGYFGMVSLKNQIIIPFRYEWIDEIRWHKDTAKWVYAAKLNGKYGLLDAQNKLMLPFDYDHIDVPFPSYNDAHRRLIVVTVNGKTGLLDWQGKTVVPVNYWKIYKYDDSYKVIGTDGKSGMLNLDGKEILPPVFDFIGGYLMDHYLVSKNRKINVVTLDGKFTFAQDFDGYESFLGLNGYYEVKRNGRYGLLDCEGKLIYPCIYKSIRYEDGKIITEEF